MFPAALLMHVHVFIQFIECIVFIKDSSCVHKKKKTVNNAKWKIITW